MAEPIIERADELPLLIYWLLRMRVDQIIDTVLPHPHPNRQGLSYGQLALIFIAFVVYLRSHRLCEMEEWVTQHQLVLQHASGWLVDVKDATDDRLGDLLSALGESEERGLCLQRQLGQHLIQAYALPTEVGRYDTSTFAVYHTPGQDGQAGDGLLRRGHSKDRRPDLLQFKQGLGVLDPAGVPIFTNTVGGQAADDPLYLPAWREMCATVGHSHFLFVADCKAAALQTRAEIDAQAGCYLFPLPMTGETPERLRAWVLHPPVASEPLVLEDKNGPDGRPRVVGSGFVVEQGMEARLEDGQSHTRQERWLVTRSDALAVRRQHKIDERLSKAETELQRLNTKTWDSPDQLAQAAQRIVDKREASAWLTCEVSQSVTQQTRYIGRGRPGPKRATEVIEVRQYHLSCRRNQAAIDEAKQLAGWRIHVTNVAAQRMSLNRAMAYYRDEFLVEHGFHRFKRGSLPVLPVFLHLPERIRGLMLLLLIALQLLTLMEYVAQRSLAQGQETLAGLVPGNPKMKSARPSAERMLARFSEINLLADRTETSIVGHIARPLTALQCRILVLLDVPEAIYTTHVCLPVQNYFNSS
jgi:transposase